MFGSPRVRIAALTVAALAAVAGAAFWPEQRIDPVTAGDSQDVVTVLDFAPPFSLDVLPGGWRHRKFWFTPPMRVSLVRHQGEAALRCETSASGSILGRHTDLDVGRLPLLEWRWLVEAPITSELDERTSEGDAPPVRLFLEFRDADNGRHAAELIWGNTRLARGDTKYIGRFPHYVADGGVENIGRWRNEAVDLLAMYRKFTGRTDRPRLTFIAVFCDSDNT